jgi:hypothetical protein
MLEAPRHALCRPYGVVASDVRSLRYLPAARTSRALNMEDHVLRVSNLDRW